MNRFNIKSKKGFTLIELLVVIGILAVLAAIMIPIISGAINKANMSADKTNANEMTNSIERFASEYELYKQDIASGKLKGIANLDGAQGRVYNVTVATTRGDLEKLESEEGLNGRAIDKDTKYPTNKETARAIVQVYTKTSSSTFEPKQSDAHYYYSPDCGIVVAQDTAKSDVASLNALVSSGVDANGQPLTQDTVWIDLTEGEDADVVIEKTYTLDEINADDHLFAIGLTKPEYVVAKYNDDYTELTIFANGDESDGKMQEFGIGCPNMPSPMTNHKDTLTTVTVKEGIVNFGSGFGPGQYVPFYGCNKVTKITLPSTIQKVGSSSFTNIANGAVIDCTTQQVVVKLMTTANSYSASTTTLLPELVDDDALTLEEINANDRMFAIGAKKPEYVIGEFSEDGTSLRIYPNGILSDGRVKDCPGAIFAPSKMSTVTEIIVEEGITYLGSTQYGTHYLAASKITSITLPTTLRTISGFAGCKNLTSVIIKADSVIVSDSAFKNCFKLSSIDFSKMTSIGNSAFASCQSIKTVRVPNSITNLYSPFQNMNSSNVEIYLGGNIKSIGSFTNLGKNSKIYCETKEVFDLFTTSKYTTTQTTVIGPDDATLGIIPVTPTTNYTTSEIDSSEYLYGIGLTKPEYVVAKFNNDYTQVTISANGPVTDGVMRSWAPGAGYSPMHQHTSTLKTLIIEEGVVNIGSGYAGFGAFQECTKLSSISLPTSLKTIGGSAFNGCTSLKIVKIPKQVETIETLAFARCTGITEIYVPASVTSIGTDAFAKIQHYRNIYFETQAGLNIFEATDPHVNCYAHALVDASKFNY